MQKCCDLKEVKISVKGKTKAIAQPPTTAFLGGKVNTVPTS